MAKIILSAFADEYSGDIDRQIDILKELGFDCLEPRFINGKNISELTAGEAKELKTKLGGLGVSAIGSPLGKIRLSDDFVSHLELAKGVFETANILGTQNVRMFSFYAPEGCNIGEYREVVLDRLGQMIALAKRFDIVLCHENEAGIYGESPDACLDLLESFHGELKCVFDMGNFVCGGYRPYPDAYDKLKHYIQYFHVKDALCEDAIVPPGCGKGCIKEVLSSYRSEFERDFVITLEPHLQTFDGLNALVAEGKKFDNPYQYESGEAAFLDATERLKGILRQI